MKKNKGFTLVELLAVIIVLGILALIIIPNVTSTLKKSEQKIYDTQLGLIKEAAKGYIAENILTLNLGQEFTIYLKQLQDGDYIGKDIQNPKTGNPFGQCLAIVVSPKNPGSSESGYNLNINEETVNNSDGCSDITGDTDGDTGENDNNDGDSSGTGDGTTTTVTYEYEYKLVTDASYGEWSSWSTTSITETATLDVETKTEYEWVGTEISDEKPSVNDEEYTASEITYSCPYDFTYLIEAPSHPSSIDGYVCTNASSADNETCKYYVYSDGICGYSPTTSDPCPNGGDFWTVGDKKYCVILTYYCIYGTFNDDYGYCEVDVYDNVTYYRYRTINSLGSTEIQWSSSDNDESLLSQGYELTGNKREVTSS